jgi:hypothetical protein
MVFRRLEVMGTLPWVEGACRRSESQGAIERQGLTRHAHRTLLREFGRGFL